MKLPAMPNNSGMVESDRIVGPRSICGSVMPRATAMAM